MSTEQTQQSLAVREERTEQLAALIDKSGSGSTNDVTVAAAFMKWAVENNCHLISPQSAPPKPPIGCEYSFSRTVIDPDPTKGQVHVIEGKLSLSKTAINRIAKMAGVKWDDDRSGRTDDGSDPNYASYKAVGWYRDFDGQVIPITGTKTMDLRDGSERAKKMKPGDLQQQRFFIAEHAETKAKLRAIREGMVIATSYTPQQLGDNHPFVVVKLALNGRTTVEDDPDRSIQSKLAEKIADNMLGAQAGLYGGNPRPELPPFVDHGPESERDTAASADGPAGENPVTGSDGAVSTPDASGGLKTQSSAPPVWTVPVGQHQGKTLDDPSLSEDSLGGLLDLFMMQEEQATNDNRNKEAQEAKLNQGRVLEELARRKQASAPPPETGGLKL
jgi:hypothetical protein